MVHEVWVPEPPGSTQPLTRPASPWRELRTPLLRSQLGARVSTGGLDYGQGHFELLKAPAYLFYHHDFKPIFKHYQGNSPNLPALGPHPAPHDGDEGRRGNKENESTAPHPPPPGKTVTRKTDPSLSYGVIVLCAPTTQRSSHEQSSQARPLSRYFILFWPLWLEPVGVSNFLLRLNRQEECGQTVSAQFSFHTLNAPFHRRRGP